VPNQFMFGSVLLVAPITAPRDPKLQLGSALAWLPEGTWIDVFTGLVYAGGRQVMMHRDLTSIPVLAGPGAIVPLSGDLVPGNAPDNPADLEVLVVVGADGAFELIEDDGTGSGLDPATVARTPIGFDQHEGCVTVGPSSGALGCLPERRTWRVTFLGLTPGANPTVTVDGTAVDARARQDGGHR
jgi:alpha-glucosidase (family GH31 glycosyl hydrolase)